MHRYVRVEDLEVDRETRERADRIAERAASFFRVPSEGNMRSVLVRWIREARDHENTDRWHERENGWEPYSGFHSRAGAIAGIYLQGDPRSVYIAVDRKGPDLVRTIAHEVAHVAYNLRGYRSGREDEASAEAEEREARAMAQDFCENYYHLGHPDRAAARSHPDWQEATAPQPRFRSNDEWLAWLATTVPSEPAQRAASIDRPSSPAVAAAARSQTVSLTDWYRAQQRRPRRPGMSQR